MGDNDAPSLLVATPSKASGASCVDDARNDWLCLCDIVEGAIDPDWNKRGAPWGVLEVLALGDKNGAADPGSSGVNLEDPVERFFL